MTTSNPDALRDKLMGLGKQSMRKNYYVDLRRELDQRIEAEEALKKLNENLENLVATRTQALLDLEKQLIQSEKLAALGGLVAGISHEVNTPLGISVTMASHLKGLTDRLDCQVPEQEALIEELKEAIWILETNLMRSVEIMDSFRRLALDQNDDYPHTLDYMDYTKGIIKSLTPELKKRQIDVSITCEGPCVQLGYPGLWSQIVVNLVKNSILHGFDKSSIEGFNRICIHFENHKQGLLCRYSDNGSGMTEAVRKAVFDPFYTTRRGNGGTGLGMFIVHQIITDRIKGTIQVADNAPSGVVFTLLLPKIAP